MVMGDVRRSSPRPRCPGGGHSAGSSLAGKKQSRCRTEQARSAWREEVRAAGRMRGRTREGAGGKCAAGPLGPQVS